MCTPHLVQLRVEIVDGREDERLDRHRLHRRAELERAVVRQDQVLELDGEIAREIRLARGIASRSMPTPITMWPTRLPSTE